MNVSVDLRLQDYRAYWIFRQRRQRTGLNRLSSYLWPLFIGLCFGALLAFNTRRPIIPIDGGSAIVGFVLGFILSLIGFFYVLRGHHKIMKPRRMGSFLGHKHYELSEDGIHERGAHGERFVRWSGMSTLLESNRHYFVIIDAADFWIFPKRAFATNAQALAFAAQVRDSLQQ